MRAYLFLRHVVGWGQGTQIAWAALSEICHNCDDDRGNNAARGKQCPPESVNDISVRWTNAARDPPLNEHKPCRSCCPASPTLRGAESLAPSTLLHSEEIVVEDSSV